MRHSNIDGSCANGERNAPEHPAEHRHPGTGQSDEHQAGRVGPRDLEVHREAAALEALSGGADASPESQEIDWLQRKAAVDRVRLVLSLL